MLIGILLMLVLIYVGVVSVIFLVRRASFTYFLYFGFSVYFLLGIVNMFFVVKIESIVDISLLNVGICFVGVFVVVEMICNGFYDCFVFLYAFVFGLVFLVVFVIRLLFC